MSIRVSRMYSRVSVPMEGAKCLWVLPVFKGESLRMARADTVALTESSGRLIDVPDYNHCQLWVPFEVVVTNSGGWPATDAAWDTLAASLLIELGASTGSEYYGGDPEADPLSSPEGVGGVTETELEGEPDSADQKKEPLMSGLTAGPIGLSRFNNDETLMRPLVAFGDDSMRFQYDRTARVAGRMMTLGVLLGVAYRYEISRPSMGAGLAASLVAPATTAVSSLVLNSSTSNLAGALWGGDFNRVQHEMYFGTDSVIDQLRTLMWGGDVRIEDDADWVEPGAVRNTEKVWASVETPYQVYR